jgi:hypothetical protein
MQIKLSKKQWEDVGKKAGWLKASMEERGSQRREKIEQTDMVLEKRKSPTEVILRDKNDPNAPLELWSLSDDYAGYVIEIDGKGYEFISEIKSILPEESENSEALTECSAASSIFEQVKASGIPYHNHQSDLYIPVNETTKEMVKNYKFKNNVTTFVNQVEGGLWYDIPFAYSPYWESKTS